jgi:hypothetical protein
VNKLKPLIAALLCMCVLMSCGGGKTGPGVSNDTDGSPGFSSVQVSLPDDVRAPSGASFTIPLAISSTDGMAGADFTLDFDSSLFSFSDVQLTSLCQSHGFLVEKKAAAGQVRLVMAGRTALGEGEGEVLSLTFTVRAGAPSGSTGSFVLSNVHLYNGTGQAVENLIITHGSVTIE